jgi:hypothetical protein
VDAETYELVFAANVLGLGVSGKSRYSTEAGLRALVRGLFVWEEEAADGGAGTFGAYEGCSDAGGTVGEVRYDRGRGARCGDCREGFGELGNVRRDEW